MQNKGMEWSYKPLHSPLYHGTIEPFDKFFSGVNISMKRLNERSRNVTEGVARAPNRSMYYAMGYQEADFSKPMVGVANGHSTITPCNSGLQKLTDAAVIALEAAGAKAQTFGTPAVWETCHATTL